MIQLRNGALVACATLALLAPALANGSPFIFYDTSHYLQLGHSIAEHFPLQGVSPTSARPDATGHTVATSGRDDHAALSYAGGRSPYYSLFLYIAVHLGGLWTAALIQCALAAWLLSLCLRAATQRPIGWNLVLVAAALSSLTTAGFYACMLMPDIFAAFALVCLILATVGWSGLSRIERLGVVVLGALATAAHATIAPVMVAVGATVALLIALLCGGVRPLKARAPWIAGSAMLLGSIAAIASFNLASRVVLHDSPRSPPYLMARVLADGYGRAYLAKSCVEPASYELCRFQNRSYRTHDEFMWSPDPRRGVFTASDSDVRRRLQSEQMRFVLGVITMFPAQELWLSLRHAAGQLVTFNLNMEFSQTALSWNSMSFNDIIPQEARLLKSSRAYRNALPFPTIDLIDEVVLLASALFIVWRISTRDFVQALRSARSMRRVNVEVVLVASTFALVSALLANAIICGAFSGVNARYEARLIWLTPLLAGVLWAARGVRSASSAKSARRTVPTLRRRAPEVWRSSGSDGTYPTGRG